MQLNGKQESAGLSLRMALAARLLTEFNRRGLNGVEMAKVSGLSETEVSKVKRGYGASYMSVEKMYEALGVLGVVVTVSIPE